jgi:four helix bundle protein
MDIKYPTTDDNAEMEQWLCRWDSSWGLREPGDAGTQGTRYDLEDRLLEFSARIIRLTGEFPDTRAANHVAGQLLRAGTSPYPNHGEAQAAESAKDFIHKLHISLKELRETHRWLRLVQRVPLIKAPNRVDPLIDECDQLIRIFVTSIRTARRNA